MTAGRPPIIVRLTPGEALDTEHAIRSASDETTRRSLGPTRGLAAPLDWAVRSHWRAVALLAGFALLAFLPGFFTIPPVDRDEARFAQSSKQMIESGQYVDIRFQDEVRYKKPIGIYWLQVAAVKAGEALGVPQARTTIWLYRLPSLAGAVGAVLATYWAAIAFVGRRAALLAGLMMASSILLGVEARLAKTDAALLLACVGAMGAMGRIYLAACRAPESGRGWAMPALLWTAIAVGVLLKGPLILMFVGLAAAALSVLDRSFRWLGALRPLGGSAWMLLLVLPWFAAILAKSGGEFFRDSVGQDMLAKVFSSQEAHGAPPGFYLVLFWVTFWPGSVLAGLAAPKVWEARREPAVRFLIAWLVPSWIVFEAVVTKLPHYVLPLYPAVAILIAGMVDRGTLSKARWMRPGLAGWFVLPAVIALALPILFIKFENDLGMVAWPFAAAALMAGLFAWRLYDVDGPERALLRGAVASIFLGTAVYAASFPSLPALFPSTLVARAVHEAGCADPRLVSTYAYQEPSLVFLLGTRTRFADAIGAADFIGKGPCRFALVDARGTRSFIQRADAIGLRYALVRTIDGFNISIGRPVSLTLFRSVSTP